MALQDLMKQAQEMQKKLQDAQNELIKLTVTGESGAGLVKVTMNGRHDVTKVEIDPETFEDETDMLEDLVAAAFNDAVRKIEKESQSRMADLAKGLNLPKDLNLPFDDTEK